MIENFKWKQNTNGFASNPQNINRNWRPIDIPSLIIKKAIQNRDIDAGMQEMLAYVNKKEDKLSMRELMNINKLSFARYWYLTWWDMKRYYKVMWIR